MCGITGIIHIDSKNYIDKVKVMNDSLYHRGPDADGIAIFENAVLGHRRLSIIDLSTGGQPMYNHDKSIAVVFNGEIYGYKEIKETLLKSYSFKSNSDTEVIIALYETYGNDFIKKLPGMFSFALWDDSKQTMIFARDRFGEKPLYYAIGKDNEFIFASEIKAIIATGLIEPEISTDSIAHYLHRLYVHPTKTIYKNVFTLPAAHMLTYRNNSFLVERYWNLPDTNETITLNEAIPKFRELFKNSIKKQLISDVPVGAFLSGGLDSTTVVSEASKLTSNMKTFAFGYEGTRNELSFARMAAQKYHTEHYELHDKDNDIAELILKMSEIYDEPFADSSSISTYLISKLTKEHAKVVLTGDGGDELLGGYYGWYRSLITMGEDKSFDFLGKVTFMRLLAQIVLRTRYKKKANFISRTRGLYYKKKFKDVFEAHQNSNVYFKVEEIKKLKLDSNLIKSIPSWEKSNTVDDAMRSDIEDYMPGDILTKIDRASMANSIELRAPFLDIEFAEFAISLPYRLKINSDEDKIILRRVFEEEWPEEIRRRSKAGFGAPIPIWLEKPKVQELVNKYLNDKTLKIFRYISFEESRKYLGGTNYKIWILLNLSIWMEKHNFK
jgi:asparagine synthase (glutamine-hydrolysing)